MSKSYSVGDFVEFIPTPEEKLKYNIHKHICFGEIYSINYKKGLITVETWPSGTDGLSEVKPYYKVFLLSSLHDLNKGLGAFEIPSSLKKQYELQKQSEEEHPASFWEEVSTNPLLLGPTKTVGCHEGDENPGNHSMESDADSRDKSSSLDPDEQVEAAAESEALDQPEPVIARDQSEVEDVSASSNPEDVGHISDDQSDSKNEEEQKSEIATKLVIKNKRVSRQKVTPKVKNHKSRNPAPSQSKTMGTLGLSPKRHDNVGLRRSNRAPKPVGANVKHKYDYGKYVGMEYAPVIVMNSEQCLYHFRREKPSKKQAKEVGLKYWVRHGWEPKNKWEKLYSSSEESETEEESEEDSRSESKLHRDPFDSSNDETFVPGNDTEAESEMDTSACDTDAGSDTDVTEDYDSPDISLSNITKIVSKHKRALNKGKNVTLERKLHKKTIDKKSENAPKRVKSGSSRKQSSDESDFEEPKAKKKSVILNKPSSAKIGKKHRVSDDEGKRKSKSKKDKVDDSKIVNTERHSKLHKETKASKKDSSMKKGEKRKMPISDDSDGSDGENIWHLPHTEKNKSRKSTENEKMKNDSKKRMMHASSEEEPLPQRSKSIATDKNEKDSKKNRKRVEEHSSSGEESSPERSKSSKGKERKKTSTIINEELKRKKEKKSKEVSRREDSGDDFWEKENVARQNNRQAGSKQSGGQSSWSKPPQDTPLSSKSAKQQGTRPLPPPPPPATLSRSASSDDMATTLYDFLSGMGQYEQQDLDDGAMTIYISPDEENGLTKGLFRFGAGVERGPMIVDDSTTLELVWGSAALSITGQNELNMMKLNESVRLSDGQYWKIMVIGKGALVSFTTTVSLDDSDLPAP